MKRTFTTLFLICALLLGLCACGGDGAAPCTKCAQKGYDVCVGHACTMCKGAGARVCAGCKGSGTIAGGSMNCFACSGSGIAATCFLCDGTGVTYNNNREDYGGGSGGLGGSGGSGGLGGSGGSGGTNQPSRCYYCSGKGKLMCSVCDGEGEYKGKMGDNGWIYYKCRACTRGYYQCPLCDGTGYRD